ncbi:carbohydrate-binding domain-containing protein, partial [Microvirga arabica]
IADAIRLISSAGSVQGSGPYKYILNTFAGQKGFWWIDVNDTLEGVFASENDKYPLAVSLAEVKEFADGHGNLGTFFFENSQDLRGAGGSYSGMKMGDSPGILYLIDQANNDNPTSESWGGEYRQVGTNHWTDLTDQALNFSDSNGARTIYEDRAAWLGDFKARFDWLSGEAPSPPPTDPAPTEPGPVEPAPTEPVPVDPTPPEPTPVDPALDTITVRISGTEYKGDPNFALLVDGKTVDTTNLVTAEHKTGQWQTFTFTGDFDAAGTQSHSVGIKFTNDRYNRDAGDRNLYVDEVTFNDQVNSSDALLTMNGAKSWDFVL